MSADEKFVNHMQEVVEQMRLDDLEENPDLADEFFDCGCCGGSKCLAGAVQYENYRLCNDCVLLAEIGFALKKITNIQDLINAMEDKRLEELCEFIKQDEQRLNN